MPSSRSARILADGRWIVILLAILYGAIWSNFERKEGWVPAWRHVRVAGLEPAMVDMRGMLGAFENYREGIPIEEIQNPSPGSHIISFTYPEAWMLFAPLGLTQASTGVLTLAAAIACVLAWLIFIGPISLWEGLGYGLITISPSLMLGVERGNGDLFIFLLVLLACVLISMRGMAPQIVGNLLFLFGGVLKVYPIAGLAPALRSWKPAVTGVLAALVFIGYLYLDRADLKRVNQYTSRDSSHSFGARVFTDAQELPGIYGFGLAAAVLTVAALCAWRAKDSTHLEEGRFGTAFLACSAMFIVCFLIGNNYVYRYRLFLLILPQVLLWARQKSLAAAVLAAAMFLTVYASNEPRLFALSEPLNWTIFGLCAYFAASIVLGYGVKFWKLQTTPEEEYLR